MELVRATRCASGSTTAPSTRGWPPTSPPRWPGPWRWPTPPGLVHRDIKPANILLSAGRAGEGGRLRHRQGGRVGRPHTEEVDARHRQVPGARADRGRARRRPHRPLQPSASSSTRCCAGGCRSRPTPSRPPPWPGSTTTRSGPGWCGPACPASSRPSPCGCWPATRPTATPRPPTCGPPCWAPAPTTGPRRPPPPAPRAARSAAPPPPTGGHTPTRRRTAERARALPGQRAPLAGPDPAGRAGGGGAGAGRPADQGVDHRPVRRATTATARPRPDQEPASDQVGLRIVDFDPPPATGGEHGGEATATPSTATRGRPGPPRPTTTPTGAASRPGWASSSRLDEPPAWDRAGGRLVEHRLAARCTWPRRPRADAGRLGRAGGRPRRGEAARPPPSSTRRAARSCCGSPAWATTARWWSKTFGLGR